MKLFNVFNRKKKRKKELYLHQLPGRTHFPLVLYSFVYIQYNPKDYAFLCAAHLYTYIDKLSAGTNEFFFAFWE